MPTLWIIDFSREPQVIFNAVYKSRLPADDNRACNTFFQTIQPHLELFVFLIIYDSVHLLVHPVDYQKVGSLRIEELGELFLNGLDELFHGWISQDIINHGQDTSLFLILHLEGQCQLFLLVEGKQDTHENRRGNWAFRGVHRFRFVCHVLDCELICFYYLLSLVEEAYHTQE